MNIKNNIYKNIFLASTDTVPGIGCPYHDKESLELIFKLKRRPKQKNIVVMVPSIEIARTFNGWNDNAEKIANSSWPGNVTIILNEQYALRMPNCDELLNLMHEIGPIYMTSANISGEPTLTIDQAILKFNMVTKHYVKCIGSGVPSKIIDSRNNEIVRG